MTLLVVDGFPAQKASKTESNWLRHLSILEYLNHTVFNSMSGVLNDINSCLLYIAQQHPITVYRTVFWVCVGLVLNVIRCSFYYFLDEFYFIIIFIMIIVTIIGIVMAINHFLNYTLGFLYLSSSGSANVQLLGCFCPWTFTLNIGLSMLHLDSFMSCLHSLLGYSTGEFQALQLIVLVAFGTVDWPFASCMLVHFLEI